MHGSRRLTAEHLDCMRVRVEVALRVRFGARAFAQHVEGAEREPGLGAPARERRIDRLADDECMSQELHRLAQRRPHDRGDHGLREARGRELARQLRRHLGQESPRRAEQREPGPQQQVAVTRNPRAAQRRKPLGDQLIGALRVGRPQQCLCQAHEGLALCAVERELLEHAVEERPGAPVGARGLHPVRGAGTGALERRALLGEVRDDFPGGVRLGAQCRRAHSRPQRLEPLPLVSRPPRAQHFSHVTRSGGGQLILLMLASYVENNVTF